MSDDVCILLFIAFIGEAVVCLIGFWSSGMHWVSLLPDLGIPAVLVVWAAWEVAGKIVDKWKASRRAINAAVTREQEAILEKNETLAQMDALARQRAKELFEAWMRTSLHMIANAAGIPATVKAPVSVENLCHQVRSAIENEAQKKALELCKAGDAWWKVILDQRQRVATKTLEAETGKLTDQLKSIKEQRDRALASLLRAAQGISLTLEDFGQAVGIANEKSE